jgi:hypothetical protein
MSLRWRWSAVVILAALVLTGFMPQALLSRPFTPVGALSMATQGAPTAPLSCTGVSCNKSSPGAPTPTLTIAALAGMVGVVALVVGGRASRRIRSLVRALPRGTTPFLFRPPQFSSFDL